jgi:hypothetical protein
MKRERERHCDRSQSETRTIANVGIKGDQVAVITRAGLKGKKTSRCKPENCIPASLTQHSHAGRAGCFSAQVMASIGCYYDHYRLLRRGPYRRKSFLMKRIKPGIRSIAERLPLNPGNCVIWRGLESPYHPHGKADRHEDGMGEQDLLEGAIGVSFGLEYAPKTSGVDGFDCQSGGEI